MKAKNIEILLRNRAPAWCICCLIMMNNVRCMFMEENEKMSKSLRGCHSPFIPWLLWRLTIKYSLMKVLSQFVADEKVRGEKPGTGATLGLLNCRRFFTVWTTRENLRKHDYIFPLILIASLPWRCYVSTSPNSHTVLYTFFLLFVLYWSIVDKQCCDSFECTAKRSSQTYTCIHSPPGSPPIQAAT